MTGMESGRESFLQRAPGVDVAGCTVPARGTGVTQPAGTQLGVRMGLAAAPRYDGSVQPDSQGRVDLARQRREVERIRADLSSKARHERRVTTRATARILDNVHLEGRMGRFLVESDEPTARGGTEQGPSPLQYLMVGTAF